MSETESSPQTTNRSETATTTDAGAGVSTATTPSELTSTPKDTATNECLCTEFVTALRTCPYYQSISDLLHWRDIPRSALTFIILNFTFFLICIAEYSFVTLFSYLALALLGASVAYSKFMAMKGVEATFIEEKVKQSGFGVDREVLERTVESTHLVLEALRKLILRIFSASDKKLTLSSVLVLLFGSQLGKLVSGYGLTYTAMLIFFIWPRLYEEKKDVIDAQYNKITSQILAKVEPLLEKIPGLKPKKD